MLNSHVENVQLTAGHTLKMPHTFYCNCSWLKYYARRVVRAFCVPPLACSPAVSGQGRRARRGCDYTPHSEGTLSYCPNGGIGQFSDSAITRSISASWTVVLPSASIHAAQDCKTRRLTGIEDSLNLVSARSTAWKSV